MGNEQSPCCCPDNGRGHEKNLKNRKISVENTEWAQALNDGDLNEVKILLSNDKNLVDEIVNNSAGYNGLHLCVINKNYIILEYLLENNSSIDLPNKLNGNTPLHEACKFNDVKASIMLIQYGADTKITNLSGKTPMQLTTSGPIKQALKNPKAYRKKKRKKKRTNTKTGDSSYSQIEQSRSASHGSQSINSQTMSYSNNDELSTRDYSYTQRIEEIPSPQNSYRNDKSRSESSVSHQLSRKGTNRSDPTTWFGRKMGVELEQVADFMRRLPNRAKMWDAFLGRDKTEITQENKNRDLFRLVFGTIYATIKKQNRSAPQPSKSIAKKIMLRIVELLANERNMTSNSLSPQSNQLTYVFRKEKFINEFHGYLYQCADDVRSGVISELN